MDNYKLPSMVKYCRAYPWRKIYELSSPYRHRTIFTRAKIHNKECNIRARSPLKNRGFEKARYNSPVGLGLYSRYLIYGIMEKCVTVQDVDEKDSEY